MPEPTTIPPSVEWIRQTWRLPVTHPDGRKALQDVMIMTSSGRILRFYCDSEEEAGRLRAALARALAVNVGRFPTDEPTP